MKAFKDMLCIDADAHVMETPDWLHASRGEGWSTSKSSTRG